MIDRLTTIPVSLKRCLRLFAALALFAAALPAGAQDCSDYPNGVLDGATGLVPPSQLQIDRHCTIRNYPASNPLGTNFSFLTQPGQTDERWIVIFDNVVHTGQMACNSVAGHKIWFTNGSSTSIQEGCQNYLIPVEKIDKQTPPGQTTAAIGVPFTYRLTMPVLFDPATGTVINTAGSVNDLHGITLWDDLNATGADLTYLSHTAYWADTGAPVSHTFDNTGGYLTFDNFPIVPAGRQIIVELTVVLDATPANTPGTQFVNTAKWDFGRLIDGEFFEPLPGEWGISAPLTIAAPDLVLTKTGPATLNLGQDGNFTLDIANRGNSDAWNATILDRLPDDASGGMCENAPAIDSARVYAADGVSTVPGKGPLVAGSDYTVSWTGASACELRLTMQSAAAAIGPGERLIVRYRSQLDGDTNDGAALTNVAGATEWFNADATTTTRVGFHRTLTNGTVGTLDHEDAHTVAVALSGLFFEKTVSNLTSGANPASTALPGETLRYELRLQTTDTPLAGARITDDLGALNPVAVFVPGSLVLDTASLPPGADASATDPNGGTGGAGRIDIANVSLPAASSVSIYFDIDLATPIANGTLATNQAELRDSALIALSDDPTVNGRADPDVVGDEDPTRVLIDSSPAFDVDKVSAYLSGDPNVLLAGETLRYTITVRNVGGDDADGVRLVDQVPVNTAYVAGSTTLNGAALSDAAGGVSPLADGIDVNAPGDATPVDSAPDPAITRQRLRSTSSSTRPLPTARCCPTRRSSRRPARESWIFRPTTRARPSRNDPTRDIVGNLPLLFAPKTAQLEVDGGTPGVVDPGDVLRYTIQVYNNSAIAATGVTLTDAVPADTTYVADTLTLNGSSVGRPDGGVSPLIAGIPISSADLTPPLPGTGNGTLSPGESALVQFDLEVNAGVRAARASRTRPR